MASACIERGSDPRRGTETPESLPRRQHAWRDGLEEDTDGDLEPPEHNVLLHLDLREELSTDAATEVENAFRTLEQAYEWSPRGLLFTVGYSHSYFDQVDVDSPVPEPEPLAGFEDPDLDGFDAVVHLASGHAAAVLEAEAALNGEAEDVNGVPVTSSLEDVFTVEERRTGWMGDGAPRRGISPAPSGRRVPDDYPDTMGFKSPVDGTQASEDRITIGSGEYEGGTTQQVSMMFVDTPKWHSQDGRWQQEAKIYSPLHAERELVEGAGGNLSPDPMELLDRTDDELVRHANEYGVVGHAQKMARVRRDDEALITTRSFGATVRGHRVFHCVALQESISDFVETREAMNGFDVSRDTQVGVRSNNGILQYLQMQNRGNYLLPPRSNRALPGFR